MCLDTHMKLALYKYASIIIIIYIRRLMVLYSNSHFVSIVHANGLVMYTLGHQLPQYWSTSNMVSRCFQLFDGYA